MPSLRFLRLRKRALVAALLGAWLAVGIWQVVKPLPAGTNVRSAAVAVAPDSVRFLSDLTFIDARGVKRSQQQIFDAAFAMIDAAHSFVVADVFLFNDSMGAASGVHRRLSSELAERLLARKRARPGLRVLLITDPVNEIYGGTRSATLERLRADGIDVVTTDLTRLRDSNPGYSAAWRLLGQWWGNAPDRGGLPNPFGQKPPHVTLRSWLALLNFKANHRKIIVTDTPDGQAVGIVMSANPHDASSGHSNVALQITSPLALQIARNELAIARFSGWQGELPLPEPAAPHDGDTRVTLLTEAAIRDQLVQSLNATQANDSVQMAMFYLAERQVIEALLAAARRGVDVRLILDPNKDAFGRQKDGVPNRPVAHELVGASQGRIQVRWYRTTGEQFHTKLTVITRGQRVLASLGSANLTRRNLGNYNLEANLAIEMPHDAGLAVQMRGYFAKLWGNEGAEHTLPFERFDDASRLRYWRYRIMEATGLSTF